jgi:hypothetical protein
MTNNPPMWARIDCIAKEFELPPAALTTAFGAAMRAMAAAALPETDDRVADSLDDLDDVLQQAIRLLGDTINRNRIGNELQSGGYPLKLNPFELMDQLAVYATAAQRAHRSRAQKSGRLAARDLRAAVDVLVRYWNSLERGPFTQNQGGWSTGAGRKKEPTARGELFVWRVLSALGGINPAKFRSIAREFVPGRNAA